MGTTAFVFDDTDFRQYGEITSAAEMIKKSETVRAIAVDSSDTLLDARQKEASQRLETQFHGQYSALFLTDSEIMGKRSEVLPWLSLNPNRRDVCTLRAIWGGRLLLFQIESVDELTRPWPAEFPTFDRLSIVSFIQRFLSETKKFADWASAVDELLATLVEAADQKSYSEMRHITELALELVGSEFKSEPEEQLNKFLYQRITEFRSRMQATNYWVHSFSGAESRRLRVYAGIISECDALVTSLANVHLLHLSRDLATAAKLQTDRDRASASNEKRLEIRAAQRDRRVAVIAATLVFPTVWLSFLGINVLPPSILGFSTQSAGMAGVALTVSIILSILGGFILRRAIADPNGGKSDAE